jgi:biopolymer transport protein ExbD
MAMQVGGGKGGPMADINVTPFIDVCLVILIIFMIVVTLTMVQLGFLSKLPQTKTQQTDTPPPEDQIVVRVLPPCRFGELKSCQIYINKDFVHPSAFPDEIKKIVSSRPRDQIIFFTAEDDVNYENAMKILNMIRSAGATNIGVLTEQVSAEE